MFGKVENAIKRFRVVPPRSFWFLTVVYTLLLCIYLQKESGLYWWDYSGYWDSFRDLVSSYNAKGLTGLLNYYKESATSEYPPTWSLVLLPIILLEQSSRIVFAVSLSLLSWIALASGLLVYSRIREWSKTATAVALLFLLLLPGVWAIPILGYPDQMAVGLCSIALALLCRNPKSDNHLVKKYITVLSLLLLAFVIRKTSIFLLLSITFVMILKILIQFYHFRGRKIQNRTSIVSSWRSRLLYLLMFAIVATLIYLSRGSFLSALNRNGDHELIYKAFKMDSPSYFYGLMYFNGLIPFVFSILLAPVLFFRALYDRKKSLVANFWASYCIFLTVFVYLILWLSLLPVGTQHHLAQWVPWLAAWFVGEVVSILRARNLRAFFARSNQVVKISSSLTSMVLLLFVTFCITTPVISSIWNFHQNVWKPNLYIPQMSSIGFPVNLPIIAQSQRPLDRSDSDSWVKIINELNSSTKNSKPTVFFLSQSQETNSSLLSASIRSTGVKQKFINNSSTVFDYRDENYLHQFLFADYIVSDQPMTLVNPAFQKLLLGAQESFVKFPIWTKIFSSPRKLDSPGVLDRTLGGGVLNSDLELWKQDSKISETQIQGIVRANVLLSDQLGTPYDRRIFLNSINSTVEEPNGYNSGALTAVIWPEGEIFLLAKSPTNASKIAGNTVFKSPCDVRIQRVQSWRYKNGVQISFPKSGFHGWILLKISNVSAPECHIRFD